MCTPALIGLAISAVSIGVSAAQQNANNKTNQWALEAQDQATKDQTAEIQKQINDQSVAEKSDRAAAAMREKAALRVAAGESGVGGVGVDIAANQSDMAASIDTGRIESNRASASRQAALNAQGKYTESAGKRASIPSQGAVWGQAGLQIAGAYSKDSKHINADVQKRYRSFRNP
jgi:hypothetical protein